MTRVTLGVSFKTYFDRRRAARWCAEVASVVRTHPAVQDGSVRLFVNPSLLQIADAVHAFAGTPVGIGVQDISRFPGGPFTGEVPAAALAEHGIRYAEIGHAERRRLFGESDTDVAEKSTAALLAGITPVVCVGEPERTEPAVAAAAVSAQLRSDLAGAPAGPVIVAYEPVWAIGAPRPAPQEHIVAVITAVRSVLAEDRAESAVVYGGSAGPGLLTELGPSVDGLFLGRFAHDPQAFLEVVHEAAALIGQPKT